MIILYGILGVCIIGMVICLIALLILDTLMKRNEIARKQIDNLIWHNEHGTPIDEMLEMPMPRKLRRQMLKIHEHFKKEDESEL